MSLNKSQCTIYITEPNGLRITVAHAIKTGDFQAMTMCKYCTEPCIDEKEDY